MNPIRSFINIAILVVAICGLVSVVKAEPKRGSCKIASANGQAAKPMPKKKMTVPTVAYTTMTYTGNNANLVTTNMEFHPEKKATVLPVVVELSIMKSKPVKAERDNPKYAVVAGETSTEADEDTSGFVEGHVVPGSLRFHD